MEEMMKNNVNDSKGEIVIYQTSDKKVEIDVRLDRETVWLTQAQVAKVFRTDRSVVGRHISNIFKSRELEEKSNVQKMHIPFSDKPVNLYRLDVIISVGYRVNSTQATQFRIWATGILKRHLIEGYTLNEKRLKIAEAKYQELQKAVSLIGNVLEVEDLPSEARGIAEVISSYARAIVFCYKKSQFCRWQQAYSCGVVCVFLREKWAFV